MKVWCGVPFSADATRALEKGLAGHSLIPELADAEVAFGQPDPDACLAGRLLRWVELSSAGYTRYDTPAIRDRFAARRIALTNTSGVFADPCAQHILAMMLALGRELLVSHREQLNGRAWHYDERRGAAVLLTGQTVVLLGFGAIGRRLAGLLAPFGMELFAVRRRTHSEAGVRIVPESELTRVLPLADHVVNILPETDSTPNYVNARRIACFKPGVRYYSVGRGITTDQASVIEGLHSGRIGAAYLDVTTPEPLPPDNPLWSTPNCYITPHSAGGHRDIERALVGHFVANFAAFVAGAPLGDRVL